MSDSTELRALEHRWEAEVKQSKLRLELCRIYLKQMQTLIADVPPPDGGHAYRSALKSEKLALAEYSRALRIYSDLVVYGRIPERDQL